jgi:hypothetical protein
VGIRKIYRTTAAGLVLTPNNWLIIQMFQGAEPTINGHIGPYMGPSHSFDAGIMGVCFGTDQYPPN